MMRLIDGDWIKDRNSFVPKHELHTVEEFLEILDEAPTIDAVPVVRCRECIHNYGLSFKGEFNPNDIVCLYWDTDGLASDDFCSYGERKDGDGDG